MLTEGLGNGDVFYDADERYDDESGAQVRDHFGKEYRNRPVFRGLEGRRGEGGEAALDVARQQEGGVSGTVRIQDGVEAVSDQSADDHDDSVPGGRHHPHRLGQDPPEGGGQASAH